MRARRRSKAWAFLSVLILAAVGAYWVFSMRPAPSDYESVRARIGNITTYYSFSGNVEARYRQSIRATSPFKINRLRVNEGDAVKAGDILAETTSGVKIKTEIDGEVAKAYIHEKDQTAAGDPLFDIVDYSNLKVNVRVDEYDVAALKEGKEVTVKIGAVGREFKAVIHELSKEGQIINDVTFFSASMNIENNGSIKIGMTSEVKLINDEAKGVITLPLTAIQFDESNHPYVFKNNENEKVLRTEIVTGINDGRTVEVKSGVSEGETVFYPKASAKGLRLLGVF